MTFIRKKKKTFKWPVVVREPSEIKVGEYDENHFIGIFNRLDRDAYEKALALNDEFKMLQKMIIGWEDITDEDGNEIAFNEKNLKDLQQDNYWLTAVVKAYTNSLTEDKLKN